MSQEEESRMHVKSQPAVACTHGCLHSISDAREHRQYRCNLQGYRGSHKLATSYCMSSGKRFRSDASRLRIGLLTTNGTSLFATAEKRRSSQMGPTASNRKLQEIRTMLNEYLAICQRGSVEQLLQGLLIQLGFLLLILHLGNTSQVHGRLAPFNVCNILLWVLIG